MDGLRRVDFKVYAADGPVEIQALPPRAGNSLTVETK